MPGKLVLFPKLFRPRSKQIKILQGLDPRSSLEQHQTPQEAQPLKLVYRLTISAQTGSHICRAGASCSHSRGVPKTLSEGSRTHPRGGQSRSQSTPHRINSGASCSHPRGVPETLSGGSETHSRGVSPEAVLSPHPLNLTL